MALIDMTSELAQAIPGMSRVYAKTLINRAWKDIENASLWSYQLQQGGFATPAITNTGSVTVAPNTATIIGDADATAAWAALSFAFSPSKQQFRVLGYSIYNIISYDDGSSVTDSPNYPYATLTLDRNFIDPVQNLSGNGYQMFMAYIPAPTQYFKRWLNIGDMFNCYALDVWANRRDINQRDPARLMTSNPQVLMGIGQDMRTGSATRGWQLFELWPLPYSAISYQTYYVTSSAPLTANTDTLPDPITETCVLTKARVYAYEWAESRKDVMAAKNSGADYLRLKATTQLDYLAQLKVLRMIDREAVDAFGLNMRGGVGSFRGYMPYYNSVTARAGMGLW